MAEAPPSGIELIKTFEGCRLVAYPDPLTGGKPYTIGWGGTRKRDGSPFSPGERITQQEADDLLIWQIQQEFLPPQARIPGWAQFSEPQQGAVLSFAYNLGAYFYGADGFETLSRVLREQNWREIERAFTLYRNPGSNVEEGLLRRRLSEAKVFLEGTPGIELSLAGKTYLSSSNRSSDPGSNLSVEAQTYLSSSLERHSASGVANRAGRRTLHLDNPYLHGNDVLEAQEALVNKGQTLVIDGVFGSATEKAVRQFQQSRGLVADGVIGEQTWVLLIDRMLHLDNPYLEGPDVLQVQQALNAWGHVTATDSVFGPTTEVSVQQFQRAKGLTADGVVGPQTRKSLGLA